MANLDLRVRFRIQLWQYHGKVITLISNYHIPCICKVKGTSETFMELPWIKIERPYHSTLLVYHTKYCMNTSTLTKVLW